MLLLYLFFRKLKFTFLHGNFTCSSVFVTPHGYSPASNESPSDILTAFENQVNQTDLPDWELQVCFEILMSLHFSFILYYTAFIAGLISVSAEYFLIPNVLDKSAPYLSGLLCATNNKTNSSEHCRDSHGL